MSRSAVVDSAQRLFGNDLARVAADKAGLDDVVARVAADLGKSGVDASDLAAIRAALVAHAAKDNVDRGVVAFKAGFGAGVVKGGDVKGGVTVKHSVVDVRAGGGAPASIYNAVSPLLEKGKLSDAQLTAGLARIHNAWFAQAKNDGYRLGERDKQDPVMKMARSFFVEVEAHGGKLSLKLDDTQRDFVRAYGRKQQPGVTLDDDAALAAGSAKILSEIKANNQQALEESMKLVTAHLGGDVTRIGKSGDYLANVKAMKDVPTQKTKPSIAPPSTEKALSTLEAKLTALHRVVTLLNKSGDAPVKRADVPKDLHGAYDLLDEEHHRWVKTQLGYGVTSDADFVPSDVLSGKRLALDAAPMRGAYETLLAGLRKGLLTPAALNAILPLLEKGALTPEQLTSGLAAIHNDWYAKAATDGYVLGERDKSDPKMKNARSFFVAVEAKGGALALKLDDEEAKFVRSYGRKDAGLQKLTDAQALEAGSEKIVAEITKNNTTALKETMNLVSAHLAGDVIRLAPNDERGVGYLDAVKALSPVETPTSADPTQAASTSEAAQAVASMVAQVDGFIAFLEDKKAKGDAPFTRDDVPADLRIGYDLFAEEHDRWLAQQIGWGASPNPDWVHTSELAPSRILLDAAPIRGALLTLEGVLGGAS